jgi:carbonic anhydrase
VPRYKFATAITCIDGRVQQPVADWMKLNTNVDYVDLITEPGPDKVLSSETTYVVNEIIRKVTFSVKYHESPVVALCGHHDCAANHANREEHIEQILEGVRVLQSYNLNVRLLGLWLNEWGSVERVCDTQERQTPNSFL